MGSIDMSTRCFICIEDVEQGYRGIYCHYDGYPGHVGEVLVKFHNSISAAEAIVFGPQIRNFDSDGTVVRFGDGTPDDSEVYLGLQEALGSGFDYAYLYSTQENCWKCFKSPRSSVQGYLEECEIPGNEPWMQA
jgi:hypothetical protein